MSGMVKVCMLFVLKRKSFSGLVGGFSVFGTTLDKPKYELTTSVFLLSGIREFARRRDDADE